MFGSMVMDIEYCPRCAKRGLQSVIKVIQVRHAGPFKFCLHPKCTYPLDLDDGGVPLCVTENDADVVQEISDDSEPQSPVRDTETLKESEQKPTDQEDCIEVSDGSGDDLQLSNKNSLGCQETKEKSDDDSEEINIESEMCVENSELDGQKVEGSSQDTVECIADFVQCSQDKIASKSDNSVVQVENSAAENEAGRSSLDTIECIEDEPASKSNDNVEHVENCEGVGGSSQDVVRCVGSQDAEEIEVDDILVDLTFSQSQELNSGDKPCDTTFEEGYAALQKIMNMCVSDEDESPCESLGPNSSTTSENSCLTALSESLPLCPQWKNKNNMCWLDSTLSLLLMSPLRTHVLKTLKGKSGERRNRNTYRWLDSLLQETFKEYQKVMRRVKRLQSRVSGPELTDVAKQSYRRLKAHLERIRVRSLEYLQNHCNVGHDESGDSPVFALSALLKKKSSMRPLFDLVTKYHLKCSSCHFQCCLSRENPIVCLVKCPPVDFELTAEGFTLRNEACDYCEGGDQTRSVRWGRLNRFLLVQFCHGLSDDRSVDEWLKRLTFEVKGVRYAPMGVVQYKELSRKTKHFVAWIRSPERDVWLEADDMSERFCIFDKRCLSFPASELHLLLFMAQSCDPKAAAPAFPLHFGPPKVVPESEWPKPAYIQLKPYPVGAGVSGSTNQPEVNRPTTVDDDDDNDDSENDSSSSDDGSEGSSGVSFASIASEHLPKSKSKPKQRAKRKAPVVEVVGGVRLKRLRVALKRCDDF